jgi:signal transduction histidine kinase
VKVTAFTDKFEILESLLNDARTEADALRKRVARYEKIILSTRLIMGHELKKPTTAINGYLDLICDDLEKADKLTTLSFAQKATKECQLLNELNLFFLELLRLDAGEENLGQTLVDIIALVAKIVERFPPHLEAKRRVKLKVAEDAGFIDINHNAFEMVLLNLIENALIYSQKNTTVWVEAETIPEKRGVLDRRLLKIRIRDDGVGIPKEYLKKIFSPFVRLREDIAEGAGLGLTLVRSLVELNGGEVYIQSAGGEGTTVHVTIPAPEDNEKKRPTLL